MVVAIEALLQRVLNAHNLACGAMISSTGTIVSRVGDVTEFDDSGLVSALLGPHGSPQTTYNSVQGDNVLLPRIWAQGEEVAFVDRVGEWVLVVFGRRIGDAASQYALSRLLHRTIQLEFTTQKLRTKR